MSRRIKLKKHNTKKVKKQRSEKKHNHTSMREHVRRAAAIEYSEEKNKLMRPAPEPTGKVVTIAGKAVSVTDIVKLAGLFVFFALTIVAGYLIWPYIHEIFEPGGLQKLIADVRAAGAVGVSILFGLQLLQIIVAVIPGEVTAIAAGMLYGPWFGALLILVGGAIASAIVYWIVHLLGAPFVHDMVPTSFLEKFREYERSGKFNVIVFVLFLIPGLPKDAFTYIIGLTDMRCDTFVILSTLARIPGVLVTTYAASDIAKGDYLSAAIIFVVFAIIAGIGLIFRDKIMGFISKTPIANQ